MSSPFQSISAQVAALLRDEVRAGNWSQRLPGERLLAERLNVSRKTVRKALAILRTEGLIQTERNRASSLLEGRSAKRSGPVKSVILLLPEPLEGARPFTVLWVNRLMGLLHEVGMELEIVSGWKYFGVNAGRSLSRLVNSHPSRCWLIARSHRALQQWFEQSGVPCIVAGTTHSGIELPSVDIDHRALCRHAALTFLRQGHRRLVLFLEKAGHGGDEDSEKGFREGLAETDDDVQTVICRPAKGPASVVNELRRLDKMPFPPTGYLLSNSFSYLTVLSHFAQQGRRVPHDVSLISRDEEPFLSHLQPMPARYAIAPAKFAAALSQAIKRVIERRGSKRFEVRIMPDFVKGASLSRPAASNRSVARLRYDLVP